MRRAREAVDAAVLAAAIGIDRAVEGNIRRIVAGDDAACCIDRDRRLERRQLFELLPAVVERDTGQRLVSGGCGRGRPPPPTAPRLGPGACVAGVFARGPPAAPRG